MQPLTGLVRGTDEGKSYGLKVETNVRLINPLIEK